MYEFSGTGKNGGFVYQFDFRIRQSCFKAIGQSEGFFKTAIITDLKALVLIFDVIVFCRERDSL
tara:strand:+ start:72 stop:263 length:192 start_codon:yes stop_codon:yes gene_type:complete